MLASYVIFEIQHVFPSRPARRHAARLSSFTSFPYLATSLPCHTSENSPVSPSIATLPKTPVSNPCVCHTCETLRGWGSLLTLAPNFQPSTFSFRPFLFIPFLFNSFWTLLHNGRSSTLLQSIRYAFFSSRRRVYPLPRFFSAHHRLPARHSFWLQRRERLCHEPRER